MLRHSLMFLALSSATVAVGQRADAQQVERISGTVRELVDELTSREYTLRKPSDDERPYEEPGEALREARHAAASLAVGDLESAAKAAGAIAYELLEFYDTDAKCTYYLLREDLEKLPAARGWGAYLLNPEPKFNALVEAPHPIDDSKTAPLAAGVFEAGARGLLLSTTHRDKADVPDLVASVFHQVHSAWIGGQTLLPVLQIHGFLARKHNFPSGADVILSTGGGRVTGELKALDRRFEESGFRGYVYNELRPDSSQNREVNEDAPGARFWSLAATKNEQGKHARKLGGKFVHVEFEQSVRHDSERRDQAARVVAETMTELAPASPGVAARRASAPAKVAVKERDNTPKARGAARRRARDEADEAEPVIRVTP